MSASELAHTIYRWARNSGALATATAMPTAESRPLETIAQGERARLEYADEKLTKAKIVGVIADEERRTVTILTKGALGPRILNYLPDKLDGIPTAYIGGVHIEANPPPVQPLGSTSQLLHHLHEGRFACGGSVTSAPVYGAGTMGCLVKTAEGQLCGLTNNHVTGDCNHTPMGMHILSPAPIDADPNGPPPTGIGRHLKLVPLGSGDPDQVTPQNLDAALFSINEASNVTSMQGQGLFDTPPAIAKPAGGMRVKKVGRTTGLTHGEIVGPWVTPLLIPYKSERFTSIVHFEGVWAVKGRNDENFSERGDSGSLVVTEDGDHAIGLIFAGFGASSLMIPMQSMIDELQITLVTGHNA